LFAFVPAAHAQSNKSLSISQDKQEALPKTLTVGVHFSDIGYSNGFRLSNLGARREIYVPVPQSAELKLADLLLSFDDVSAHEARRSLEILVNDRLVMALPLDGKRIGSTVRIPLANIAAREGFLKISFLYSGAATQDRCIDVRYVGDSLTVRPESAVEFEIGSAGPLSIMATAALMPKNVAILLSNDPLRTVDISAALMLSRSLTAIGRQVTFHYGVDALPALIKREDRRQWTRGLIVVGALDRIAGFLDRQSAPINSTTGARPDNTLAASRIDGVPVLLITEPASALPGWLQENPSFATLRDSRTAFIGSVSLPRGGAERVTFDERGLLPGQVEVFGRAEISVVVAKRALPNGSLPVGIVLDMMVAPDGAGERAVVSAFVNDRLLASAVAVIGGLTRLELDLPVGLVGTVANIRVVVQRRNALGDCRFEPQGYPAEILGSSLIKLGPPASVPEEFSDLTSTWASGVEIFLPAFAVSRPLAVIATLSNVLNVLSKNTSPIVLKFVDAGVAPVPSGPFIVVGNIPPAETKKRVRFDLGRVTVTDRADRTRLDVGGLNTGAVVQLVTTQRYAGLWIKSLASDGSLPVQDTVNLDRGNVAFLDRNGVALALSTERDTLLRISYAEHGSWLTVFERFRSWILGSFWVFATIVLLFVLQRMYRRRVTPK
jgi:hypothetical protein